MCGVGVVRWFLSREALCAVVLVSLVCVHSVCVHTHCALALSYFIMGAAHSEAVSAYK